ncbi:unnamed protein product [Prunus armeniaca]|uniref:Uncharacterized protein n=1 Tax=Prunus armeniaca TaxID=36596 RepID=A0A6J5TIC0_PRUAR|nr:unnamed protein product [Prunus armeniaca]
MEGYSWKKDKLYPDLAYISNTPISPIKCSHQCTGFSERHTSSRSEDDTNDCHCPYSHAKSNGQIVSWQSKVFNARAAIVLSCRCKFDIHSVLGLIPKAPSFSEEPAKAYKESVGL